MSSEVVQRFENIDKPDIRKRLNFDEIETKQYLDSHIEGVLSDRAVEHPFLTWYTKNRLTKDQERKLFLECFYFFRYLPYYIAGMAMSTRSDEVLREIILNVYDEVCGEVTHSSIYRQFLHLIGISDEDIETYHCLPTTTALNEGIKKLYTEMPIAKSLGALYADEAMSAIMTAKLNEGLKNQGYDEQTRYFWVLHTEVEVGHSNSVFNAIFPYIKEENTKELFEEGMTEFLDLVEAYWDGVDVLIRGDQAAIRTGT
ncbi:MAG TPA: iron-containing redox enzyme family protein [Pyrinomonadaceae bacterium]|jgi:pyrroloquinoline-quinone synthase